MVEADDEDDWDDIDPVVVQAQEAAWHEYRKELAADGRCIHGVYSRTLAIDFKRPLDRAVYPDSEWTCMYCGAPELTTPSEVDSTPPATPPGNHPNGPSGR